MMVDSRKGWSRTKKNLKRGSGPRKKRGAKVSLTFLVGGFEREMMPVLRQKGGQQNSKNEGTSGDEIPWK